MGFTVDLSSFSVMEQHARPWPILREKSMEGILPGELACTLPHGEPYTMSSERRPCHLPLFKDEELQENMRSEADKLWCAALLMPAGIPLAKGGLCCAVLCCAISLRTHGRLGR